VDDNRRVDSRSRPGGGSGWLVLVRLRDAQELVERAAPADLTERA
jgi:hypothetical protein